MVDFSTCLIMCRCPIVVLIDFLGCFLTRFHVRPGKVLRKSCFIALISLAVVGLKSAT